MRIALWIAAGVLGALLLCALLPWLLLKEFRATRQGGDFLFIILTLAVLLTLVVSKLVHP